MDERILRRIDRASGIEDIVGVLEGLPPTNLQSLLLAVYRRRAGRMTAKAVLDRYEHSRFVTPASSSPGQLVEFDRRALSLVPDSYEPIELSPLAPLGAASVLGKVSQDWAVPTARNTEVVSDSTNVSHLNARFAAAAIADRWSSLFRAIDSFAARTMRPAESHTSGFSDSSQPDADAHLRFNNHDADGRMSIEAPDIEVVMPGGMTSAGTRRSCGSSAPSGRRYPTGGSNPTSSSPLATW